MALAEYWSGMARLVVLSWSAIEADTFIGERVAAHLLEYLPGR